MNKPFVPSAKVIAALKQEGLRRKACAEDLPEPNSVASAKTKPSKDPKQSQKRCKFCNVDGHNLNNCFNTAKVLCDYKSRRGQGGDTQPEANQSGKPKASKPQRQLAKAGRSSKRFLCFTWR
jgi:hypothetical protein